MSGSDNIILGTRGSLLAQKQSAMVASALQSKWPNLNISTVVVKTTGDRVLDKPLHEFGGKGLFVKELEEALLGGQVDFAVHSFKDVPVTMPLVEQENLIIAATPPRADARDILISRIAATIRDLPTGAKVATGSLRRMSQLLFLRPDLKIQTVRGNIDTRLRKLRDGEFDALILAAAGMDRAGLFDDSIMHPIPIEDLLPAPGQGVLALQCRANDARTIEILRSLHDSQTWDCVQAERAVVKALEGDCHSPIAAYATKEGSNLHLHAAVGRRDGQPPVIRASGISPIGDFMVAVDSVVKKFEDQGAWALLHSPPSENS